VQITLQRQHRPWHGCQGWSATSPCFKDELLVQHDQHQHAPPSQPDSNANTFPENPRHKRLLPLSIADVIGWLIAGVTIFIAAGARSLLYLTVKL
jgi:hypothetical protein